MGDGTDGGQTTTRLPPFWEQYQRLKARYPDALLWTRVGDFYETFAEDAQVTARELHITLTSREVGKGMRVPLAGVPYHAAQSYLARLIRKGYHVAICEQLSEAGHGLVERDVVRVVTPGTLAEPGLLPQRTNNYLAAVLWTGEGAGLAYVDVTTGEFGATEWTGSEAAEALDAELRRLLPAECLTPVDQVEPCPLPGHRTAREAWHFEAASAAEQLAEHFGTRSLVAFGCDDRPLAIACAGAILHYVGQTNPDLLPLLTGLHGYQAGSHMLVDGQTRRNLNLTTGARGGQEGSLLAILDQTKTAMGARQLRRWLGQPLLSLEPIRQRQERIAAFKSDGELRGALRTRLERVLDVERLAGRCCAGSASVRDVWALHDALQVAATIARLGRSVPPPLQRLFGDLDPCADVAELIAGTLATPDSGRTIAAGHSTELDELLSHTAADRAWIAELETQERQRTGIRSLKVGSNKVFGYYIEVTNPNRALVPAHYVRKQTVAGAERYITTELKEVESRVMRMGEDVEALERRLFAALLREVATHYDRLLALATRLAELDALCALADVADRCDWTRPLVDDSTVLQIKEGRHPVVEAALPAGDFIPNDCLVAADGPQVLLLTGPNMAGKSTYLRQVAVVVLLAQIGSFVPAEQARVGLVDRIFTRVGAHDDLAGGSSTFMVEMQETATICRQATERSLVVLDEVGRGTSTADGRAIAQAVVEHLHDGARPRTLFATHFHDLATLAEQLPRLQLWTFDVLELCGQVAFTHKLTPGTAERSYGLHVARLAGLPTPVVDRAQSLLAAPEERRQAMAVLLREADGDAWSPASAAPPAPPDESRRVLAELADVDVATTTPLQALLKLAELRQAARRALER